MQLAKNSLRTREVGSEWLVFKLYSRVMTSVRWVKLQFSTYESTGRCPVRRLKNLDDAEVIAMTDGK